MPNTLAFFYLNTFDKQPTKFTTSIIFETVMLQLFTVIGFGMFIRVLNFSVPALPWPSDCITIRWLTPKPICLLLVEWTLREKCPNKCLKKCRAIILRLFENINIKHHNIMNSRIKTNWELIENITVEVPNTASIRKDIFSMFLSFLKEWSFKLCLKLLS